MIHLVAVRRLLGWQRLLLLLGELLAVVHLRVGRRRLLLLGELVVVRGLLLLRRRGLLLLLHAVAQTVRALHLRVELLVAVAVRRGRVHLGSILLAVWRGRVLLPVELLLRLHVPAELLLLGRRLLTPELVRVESLLRGRLLLLCAHLRHIREVAACLGAPTTPRAPPPAFRWCYSCLPPLDFSLGVSKARRGGGGGGGVATRRL